LRGTSSSQTWGWKDLCPICTERIKHCDCFNDELLVLTVERLGPKWELIRVLDGLMAKQNSFDPQFEPYTSDQLRERWEVIVERAEKHMEKVEKLRAYQEKKRQDAMRRRNRRLNLTTFLSRRSALQAASKRDDNDDDTGGSQPSPSGANSTENSSAEVGSASSGSHHHLCSLREKKILEINSKIKLDAFEKHYDSNISDVFHALTRTVLKHRRHDKHGRRRNDSTGSEGREDEQRPTLTQRSSSSDGETMWVFDTPEKRLQRREEEKLQRKRAFRVLNDYDIETVEPVWAGTTSPVGRSSQQDSKAAPLLPAGNKTSARRDQDVVVVVQSEPDESRDTLDELASARVDDDYDDDDEYPSDLESGNAASSNVPASGNHAYMVTEKPQTLLRRVSASASAFAAWALKYDPKVEY